MEINEKLKKDIESYCSVNGLDSDQYVNNLLKKAFMVDKYGERPMAPAKEEILEDRLEETGHTVNVVEVVVEQQPSLTKERKTQKKVKEPMPVTVSVQSETPVVEQAAVKKPRKRKLS